MFIYQGYWRKICSYQKLDLEAHNFDPNTKYFYTLLYAHNVVYFFIKLQNTEEIKKKKPPEILYLLPFISSLNYQQNTIRIKVKRKEI